MKRIRLCAAAVAALAAFTVRAQTTTDTPILGSHGVADWPTEVTRRPLTLGAGMAEVYFPVNINLQKNEEGKPISSNPSLYFGLTDSWMIGVRHLVGLCYSGSSNGCDRFYQDVSVDTVFSLGRAAGLDLGLGLAVNYAPIAEKAWSGEARVIVRAGGGPLALTVAPTINFGLNGRDTRTKWAAGTFDVGGTYNLVRPIPDEISSGGVVKGENREIISVPGTLQLQLGPTLALAGGIAIEGPINPSAGSFGDYYRVPVSAAVIVTPIRWIDIGASFTYPDLLGKTANNTDFRSLGIFAAFRI
ncbi:hypothetical protein [Anaeromyxobacter oryzae]|uniref:Uncharacterized protein n=1 Tax=Anaeromyxobacter oryzae TaxID=2918170 RepID=A0ABN6MWJ2_9BACT|nr:hypothetical protein [Anaeromyxobacter oryzae]BDG05306.1 hypothetical protein AMOR_43020 [Anaeromyxobacter oryzae]